MVERNVVWVDDGGGRWCSRRAEGNKEVFFRVGGKRLVKGDVVWRVRLVEKAVVVVKVVFVVKMLS